MIFAAKNETMRLFSRKKIIRVRKGGLIALSKVQFTLKIALYSVQFRI